MKNKTTRRNKKRNRSKYNKKQKGGILLKMESTKAFQYFVNHSKIELLTDSGAFGIIIRAKLNKDLESPYEMFGPQDFKRSVPNILIKLVALNPNKKYDSDEDDENDEWDYLNGKTKRTDHPENFIKEVNIQTDIFFKTMEYLQPLCPAPVFSEILTDKKDMEHFMNLLINHTDDSYTKKVFYKMMENMDDDRIPSLGVLGMEIADGFDTMYNYYKECERKGDKYSMHYYEWCEQMAKLQILHLALKTGYSQNDFHRGNLLVNPDYNGFYKNFDGKVIIIDFGLATKLTSEDLYHIREYYEKGNYTEALSIFESFNRSDDLEIKEYPEYYGWLYNNVESYKERPKLSIQTDDIYDTIINKLRLKEESAIDSRIKYFDEKHNLEPDKYPLLPLSNAIKNSFYQGMIGGGVQRKKRKTRKQH